MSLREVLSALQEMDSFDVLQKDWDETMMTFPTCRPSFLVPAEFKTSREWCGFDAGVDLLLEDTANRIAANPALLRLAWYYYWSIFECRNRSFKSCPLLENSLGPNGGILYLLVGLALVPRLRAFHETLGLPEEVSRATCQQVRHFSGNYARAHDGRLGLLPHFSWLRNYAGGNLYFRIGRLEYWAVPFSGEFKFHAFRNRATGAVVALAAADVYFNEEGFIETTPDGTPPVNCWRSSLTMDNTGAKGYPLAPGGHAIRREISLPYADWQPVQGDMLLSIHIPAGGDMTLDKCADSLRQAVEFFKRYFPERSPVAFTSISWIFSPFLENILPPTSNLVRFAREFYLLPSKIKSNSGPWFVFLQDQFDLRTAPRETSLQRAILGFLEAGHAWRDGNAFLLVDDLPHFGTQYYRTRWSMEKS